MQIHDFAYPATEASTTSTSHIKFTGPSSSSSSPKSLTIPPCNTHLNFTSPFSKYFDSDILLLVFTVEKTHHVQIMSAIACTNSATEHIPSDTPVVCMGVGRIDENIVQELQASVHAWDGDVVSYIYEDSTLVEHEGG